MKYKKLFYYYALGSYILLLVLFILAIPFPIPKEYQLVPIIIPLLLLTFWSFLEFFSNFRSYSFWGLIIFIFGIPIAGFGSITSILSVTDIIYQNHIFNTQLITNYRILSEDFLTVFYILFLIMYHKGYALKKRERIY